MKIPFFEVGVEIHPPLVLKGLWQERLMKMSSGPVELGWQRGRLPPNISTILPIFPEINPKIVKIWVILGLSPPQYLYRPLNNYETVPALLY